MYEDTRQRAGKHDNIKVYCDEYGIRLVRTKLAIGDYLLETMYKRVYVDTKRNLAELGYNLFNKKDKVRFETEIQKAKAEEADFIILVEDTTSFEEWINPRAGKYYTYSGRDIENKLCTLGKKYKNIYVAFCDREHTAATIIGILTGIIHYEWDEEAFQEQEEWAARAKVAESTSIPVK